MKYVLATALASALLAGGAWAHPSSAGEPTRLTGWSALEAGTGAGAGPMAGPGPAWLGHDLQGRDLRSSTRGNAQFPERPPAAQNLGATSGGPAF